MSSPGENGTPLRRALKAHHLFALSFGTIVRTGWITGLGIWLGLAGSLGSALGMALGGTVMILVAVCYAQLAMRHPTAAGEIAYAHHMWGRDTAFITGWCMVLVYVTAISFQTVALAWMLEVLIGPQMRLQSELPAVAAFERAFASSALAKLVLAAGLLGVLSCWNSSVYAAGRVLYSMAERRMIPGWFERLHPVYATPGRAALFASVAGVSLLLFGRVVIHPIVNASGSSLALVALIVCLGLLRTRLGARRSFDHRGSGVSEGGLALPAAAALGAAFVVAMAIYEARRSATPGVVPLEWTLFGIWIVFGAVFRVITRRSTQARAGESLLESEQ